MWRRAIDETADWLSTAKRHLSLVYSWKRLISENWETLERGRTLNPRCLRGRDSRRHSADCGGELKLWARPRTISSRSSGRDSRRPAADCRWHDGTICRFQGGNCGFQLPKKGRSGDLLFVWLIWVKRPFVVFQAPTLPSNVTGLQRGGLCYWCVCLCGPT